MIHAALWSCTAISALQLRWLGVDRWRALESSGARVSRHLVACDLVRFGTSAANDQSRYSTHCLSIQLAKFTQLQHGRHAGDTDPPARYLGLRLQCICMLRPGARDNLRMMFIVASSPSSWTTFLREVLVVSCNTFGILPFGLKIQLGT
jgi:hypothetical protein